MFSQISVVTPVLKSLFDATASIYVDNPTITSNITTHPLTKLLGTVRCRVSYKRVMPVVTNDIVDKNLQHVTLIYALDTAIQIPEGSKVVVTWDDGRTKTFWNSGLPRTYQYSVQVPLENADVKP